MYSDRILTKLKKISKIDRKFYLIVGKLLA